MESSENIPSRDGPTGVGTDVTLLMTFMEKERDEQTEHAWSVIDHERGKARRHRSIQREIYRARRAR